MLPDGPVTLDSDDIQVRLQAKEGWAAAQGHAVVVVLATELTDELIREGLARELVRTIQDRRKEMGCQFTDRIAIGIVTESAEIKAAIEQFREYIRGETLAVEITLEPLPERRVRRRLRWRDIAFCCTSKWRNRVLWHPAFLRVQ